MMEKTDGEGVKPMVFSPNWGISGSSVHFFIPKTETAVKKRTEWAFPPDLHRGRSAGYHEVNGVRLAG
jgi:hypothetical protein